ncbi:MAG TPA: hypothetical protein H9671_08970 [Firmicutes bacterium]|nr:hypothetical protein [Bacillota bacterium]
MTKTSLSVMLTLYGIFYFSDFDAFLGVGGKPPSHGAHFSYAAVLIPLERGKQQIAIALTVAALAAGWAVFTGTSHITLLPVRRVLCRLRFVMCAVLSTNAAIPSKITPMILPRIWGDVQNINPASKKAAAIFSRVVMILLPP